MSIILDVIRQTLKDRYKHECNLELIESDRTVGEYKEPLWISGDFAQSTRDPDYQSVQRGATLLDSDAGVALRFVPFEDESGLKGDILRALALRSCLQRVSTKDDDSDELGSWRVVLMWYVALSDQERWTNSIANVRGDTGFSEELSFELLTYEPGKETQAVQNYSFPRLHLALRKALGFAEEEEAGKWLSADEEVGKLLQTLPFDYSDPIEKEIVRRVAALKSEAPLLDQDPQVKRSEWQTGSPLTRISIHDFRNLSNVSISFPDTTIKSLVIFGPNGTGKSSIAEAIALARFGVSPMLERFCSERERDVSARNRADEFREKYLTPIWDVTRTPYYSVNGTRKEFTLAEQSDQQSLLSKMDRNVLTQEQSIQFSNMSASECAVRVLQGYSLLADMVREFVEGEAAKASEDRQTYLRSIGLGAQITKLETVQERIIQSKLEALQLDFPVQLTAWLRSLEALPSQRGGELLPRIERFRDNERKAKISALVTKRGATDEDRKSAVIGYIEDFNLLASLITDRLREVRDNYGEDPQELNTLSRSLDTWGTWVESQSIVSASDVVIESSEKGIVNPQTLEAERKELEEIRRRGRLCRDQVAHLESTQKLLESGWAAAHSNECPSCGLDVSSYGGIIQRVESLLSIANKEVESLSTRATELRAVVESFQVEIAKTGSKLQPLSEEERTDVLRAFQWLTPVDTSFESYIATPGNRQALVASAVAISSFPELPKQREDLEEQATLILTNVEEESERASTALKLPTAWEAIKQSLLKKLTAIVEGHLPRTTEKLWRETALSLTSANWVNNRLPQMKATTTRREQKLTLQIEDRLPRYILNQCESHVLGLAWFFVEYLLKGRFETPLVLLDDPAQEMDQTTYREFVRFLETFVRLHRKTAKQLTLITLMHQETRAFELANAIRSFWMTLDWKGRGAQASEMSLAYDPSLYPSVPKVPIG